MLVPKELKFTIGPYAHCPECNFVSEFKDTDLHAYFEGKPKYCDTCHSLFDWFKALTHSSDFTYATYTAVRAVTTHFSIKLAPGESKEVDFTREMGGEDGRILMVKYQARGESPDAVTAIELHDATPVRRNRPKVSLYGRGGTKETAINIDLIWSPRSKDDPSWESLVDSYEALNAGEYADALMPANVAFEVRLGRFLNDLIRSKTSIGKDRVERFLSDGATYGHQVDVLLPFVWSVLALPPLPNPVAAGLKKLRKHRNALAHRGEPDSAVAKTEAISMAVSAVLGCIYVDYLRKRLGLDAA